MPLQIILYEDSTFKNFYPLTYFRPIAGLRSGIMPLYQRVERFFPNCDVSVFCRKEVAQSAGQSIKGTPINMINSGFEDILLLNSRIKNYADLPKLIADSRISTVYINKDQVLAVLLKKDLTQTLSPLSDISEYFTIYENNKNDFADYHTSATLYNYNWQLMADIESEIIADFAFLKENFPAPANLNIHEAVSMINSNDIYLGSNVEIKPGVVLDASRGPIYIGDMTKVESHALLNGPLYIGPNSQIMQGKISSSSIGHTCRVGGEVEWSIFQSYVNKYHAGFVGHSYVGSWVNFGAMTTNSDLKNNYGNIRTKLNGKGIDTGTNKAGSFIGDHTKFGIGTLLNTGINIGVCSNLFGGTLLTDKEIASFSWGNTSNYKKNQVDKVIESAQIVCSRRNVELTNGDIEIMKSIASNETSTDGTIDFSY